MKKVILLTIAIPLFIFAASTGWARYFMAGSGGPVYNRCYDVIKAEEGNYVVTGHTTSAGGSEGYVDLWLAMFDENGDTVWTNTYGGQQYDEGNCVKQTLDGGFIITGYTASWGADSKDLWLLKTDSLGDTLWTKTYGWGGQDRGNSVLQTSDGGYIVAGFTEGFVENGVLLKTDESGNLLWSGFYGGTSHDELLDVEITNDGGYMALGETWSPEFGFGLWLLKTDSQGDTLWTKTYGGDNRDIGYYVKQTSDGGYIISGITASFGTSGSWEHWLLKTDSNGDTLWSKVYCPTAYFKTKLEETPDGGYVIVCNGWTLIKTDASGDTLWTRQYRRSGYSVDLTNDGGYVVAAGYCLYKTDENGDIGDVGPISANIIEDLEFGTYYPITATIENFGRTTEAFDAYCFILCRTVEDPYSLDTVYWDTTFVDSMAGAETREVAFEEYDFPQYGGYHIHVKTMLDGDADPYNDRYVSPYFGAGIEEQPPSTTQPTFSVVTGLGSHVLLSSQSEERSKLNIFDASGRLVDEVVLDGPGTFSWPVTPAGFSPGVYFIRETSGQSPVAKVILVR